MSENKKIVVDYEDLYDLYLRLRYYQLKLDGSLDNILEARIINLKATEDLLLKIQEKYIK